MKHGIGNWTVFDDGVALGEKNHSQIVCETQRMLGQQSIKEYYRLHVDPYKVGKDNFSKANVTRKNGLITNVGSPLTNEEIEIKRRDDKIRYGIPFQSIKEIYIPQIDEIDGAPVNYVTRSQQIAKLTEYKNKLKTYFDNLRKIRKLKAQGVADKDIILRNVFVIIIINSLIQKLKFIIKRDIWMNLILIVMVNIHQII